MAHPFASKRQGSVERSRAASITKSYATGGSVHSDEAQDRKMIRRMVKSSAMKLHGGSVKERQDRPNRARGGALKSKAKGVRGSGNKVNIIIAPSNPAGGAVPGVGPAPGAPPPAPMKPPMPPAPPPGMAPPGMPMRARGGKVTKKEAGGSMQGKRDGVVRPNFPGPKSEIVRGPYTPPPAEDREKMKELTRAKGGKVCADTAGIGKGRTPVQHTDNMAGQRVNIGRKPVITKKTGGPIVAPEAAKAGMAPNSGTGAGGGKSRLDKAHNPGKYEA